MLIVFGVYATAGVIGFIYGLFYDYHWERWYQDFQQTLYFVGYFFVTFYVLSSQRRWYWFLGLFVGFLGLKNIIIFQRLFEGTGRMLGEFGMRTTQSADAAIFPLFFILGLVLILHQRTNFWIKLTLISVLVIYLFNLLIGFGRTIWVVLPVLALYIFFEIDKQQKRKLVLSSILFLTLSIGMALFFFPRYFDLFFWKFSSIFDWSVQGDRSNATRLLEILNIGFRLFDQFAVFHGMGLGAWWDDRFFQLLPDAASGFMGKTRFHTAHLWIVQQWLKIGLIGIVVYWWTISKMFLKARTIMKSINGNEINRMLLLALNAGFIGLFFASTDFVKVFLVVGVVSGMIARLCFFILQNKPMTKLA
ncbi:MAG: hypothetical protein HY960_07960 [Ignavibacteriae bacterium]|nr:hypothetical protein [Ignavibacteriota bacterium]